MEIVEFIQTSDSLNYIDQTYLKSSWISEHLGAQMHHQKINLTYDRSRISPAKLSQNCQRKICIDDIGYHKLLSYSSIFLNLADFWQYVIHSLNESCSFFLFPKPYYI